MSETVTRHRGAHRDGDGKWHEGGDAALKCLEIAPGGGSRYNDRLREGETIACTVFFALGTDLVNEDELTVRGERYQIIVNEWRSRSRGGLEVLCTRGEG